MNVVTELEKFEKFYPAEEYHQNFFAKNPDNPYCQYVILPKVEKFLYNNKKRSGK
nr:peptide-methionine (S)-S-oxide reductase [Lebetimonas natsushimae]